MQVRAPSTRGFALARPGAVAAPGPFPASSPPALATLARVFLGSHHAENGVSPLVKPWVRCLDPIFQGGRPAPGVSHPPIKQFPPRTAVESLGCTGITEPGGLRPSFPRPRQAEAPRAAGGRKPGRLGSARTAGWVLMALGDFTRCGDPEPLGAGAQGFFCSHDSFGGCFSLAESLPCWRGAGSWHGCGKARCWAGASARQGDASRVFLLLIRAALSPPVPASFPPSCRNTTRSNRSSFTCSY